MIPAFTGLFILSGAQQQRAIPPDSASCLAEPAQTVRQKSTPGSGEARA